MIYGNCFKRVLLNDRQQQIDTFHTVKTILVNVKRDRSIAHVLCIFNQSWFTRVCIRMCMEGGVGKCFFYHYFDFNIRLSGWLWFVHITAWFLVLCNSFLPTIYSNCGLFNLFHQKSTVLCVNNYQSIIPWWPDQMRTLSQCFVIWGIVH